MRILMFCEEPRSLKEMMEFLEQKHIVKKIEELFTRADVIEGAAKLTQEHCEKMTQLILAKTFRGELVPQDPIDDEIF